MRRFLSSVALACVGWAAWGCESSPPYVPPPGRDAGHECSEGDGGLGPCPAGEVCIGDFCYAQCSATSPCGPLEECSARGVCVLRTGPGTDAGTPDPCEMTSCTAPAPFCRAGQCLQCEDRSVCGGATPVCDLARGVCTSFSPVLCAPCSVDADCVGGGDPTLRCLVRGGAAPTESVCVPSCEEAECPAGFECESTSMRCVPRANGSCTAVRASLDGSACDGDAACAPIGATATTGLIAGACFDASGGGTSTCHVPCEGDGDCPAGGPATCSEGFCR